MENESNTDTLDRVHASRGLGRPRCDEGDYARITDPDQPFLGLVVRITEIDFAASFTAGEWVWRCNPQYASLGADRIAFPADGSLCADRVLTPIRSPLPRFAAMILGAMRRQFGRRAGA